MRRRLILWDIDGTLVRCGDPAPAAFDLALQTVVGYRPPRRIAMAGKTDPQIVAEYLQLLHLELNQADLDRVFAELQAAVAEAEPEIRRSGIVMPGIVDILSRIDADPDMTQTVLTGNIAPNAVVKLRALDLLHWFDMSTGAFGSDHADRCQLVPIAVGRVVARWGRQFDPGEIWVVGDAPNDLAAARAAGVRCLLVGTGRTPLPELAALAPDAVRSDLLDTDAVAAILAS